MSLLHARNEVSWVDVNGVPAQGGGDLQSVSEILSSNEPPDLSSGFRSKVWGEVFFLGRILVFSHIKKAFGEYKVSNMGKDFGEGQCCHSITH